MRILQRVPLCALAVLLVLAPMEAATAAGTSETVAGTDWLHWLRNQAQSFDDRTDHTALAVRLHTDSSTVVDLHGVVNPDGSMVASFTAGESMFDVRCADDQACWLRRAPERLWHRVSANEFGGLRSALPELDGLLGTGVMCAIEGSTGTLDYNEDGTVIRAVVSFADGAFTLEEHLAVPADGIRVTVTKSLSPVRPVVVRAPRASAIGPPMVRDVVPELP